MLLKSEIQPSEWFDLQQQRANSLQSLCAICALNKILGYYANAVTYFSVSDLNVAERGRPWVPADSVSDEYKECKNLRW